MVPGVLLIVNNWDDMNTELGASWSPVGPIVVGFCAVCCGSAS